MGIFPEGTRSRRPDAPFLQTGKTGVARLSASHPDVPVHPCVLVGAREVMAPGDKILRPWKKVEVSYGEGITWNEWLLHPGGGNQDEDSIRAILDSEGEEQRTAIGSLYRHFTNQLIGSLAALGAP